MWSALGVKSVSPELAMQVFDKLMHHDVEQIAIAVADWPTYAGKVGKPAFLAELLSRNEDLGSPRFAEGKVAPAASPMVVNDQTRQQLLNRLQQRMMAELGFVEPIDPDQAVE
jgi:hypothetical protein